jgi:hypothetical protein
MADTQRNNAVSLIPRNYWLLAHYSSNFHDSLHCFQQPYLTGGWITCDIHERRHLYVAAMRTNVCHPYQQPKTGLLFANESLLPNEEY